MIQAIIHKCKAPETGYWAEVPSLPGCVTQGETLEEIRAMIQDAATAWLEAANTVCDTELLVSFREAADMEAGITPRQDFASVEELFADCSH